MLLCESYFSTCPVREKFQKTSKMLHVRGQGATTDLLGRGHAVMVLCITVSLLVRGSLART